MHPNLPDDIAPCLRIPLSEQLKGVRVELTEENEAIRLSREGLVMDLDWIGEGYEGDYDEDDQEDERLLRFTFYILNEENGETVSLEDASYCTHLTVDLPLEARLHAAGLMFGQMWDAIGPQPDPWGSGIKRLCEELSMINKRDLEPFLAMWREAGMDEALPDPLPKARPSPRL